MTLVSIASFGGGFDPASLRLPSKLNPALKKMLASDARDRKASRARAHTPTETLQTSFAGVSAPV